MSKAPQSSQRGVQTGKEIIEEIEKLKKKQGDHITIVDVVNTLKDKVVVPEEKWLETLKLATVEDDRAKWFKEKHDEDHLKLERIKTLIENHPKDMETTFEWKNSKGETKIEPFTSFVYRKDWESWFKKVRKVIGE